MNLNKNIFREYDIRGVYGIDIDRNVAYLIGRAFGTKLRKINKDTTIQNQKVNFVFKNFSHLFFIVV